MILAASSIGASKDIITLVRICVGVSVGGDAKIHLLVAHSHDASCRLVHFLSLALAPSLYLWADLLICAVTVFFSDGLTLALANTLTV